MSYRYFKNETCDYYPCHKGIADADFSCLFCYCPLYLYGERCGGIFHYSNGVKDCSDCTLPHEGKNYDVVVERLAAFVGELGNNHE